MSYFTFIRCYSDDVYYGGDAIFVDEYEDMELALEGVRKSFLDLLPCDAPEIGQDEDDEEKDVDDASDGYAGSELRRVLAAIQRGEIRSLSDFDCDDDGYQFEVLAHGAMSHVAEHVIARFEDFADDVQDHVESLREDEPEEESEWTVRLLDCRKLMEKHLLDPENLSDFREFTSAFAMLYSDFHPRGIAF